MSPSRLQLNVRRAGRPLPKNLDRAQQAGATDETRQAMEEARHRLQVAYTEYQDLLEAVEAVA